MKKLLLILAGCMFCCCVFAQEDKSLAKVEQIEGLYVFHLSKPVAEYEYLGTYKVKLIWDDDPKRLLSKILRKTKEQYPKSDAVILSKDMGQCDAVKFKE